MFIKFRKDFCRFLIPISLLINPLFSPFFEKVNAQNIKLTCDMKSHSKGWGNDYWDNFENKTWTIEIDYENNLLVRRVNYVYKGKNYPLIWNYLIATFDRNKIVAFEDDMTSEKGGLSAGSITLDLDKGKLTAANHMNDERGYSFSLYYGKCFNR